MGRKSKRKKFRRAEEHSASLRQQSPPRVLSRENHSSGLFLVEIIRWGAYAALFAPLIVHPSFFFPFVVPKAIFFWIFSEVIFFAWLLLAIPNKAFRPRLNLLSLAFGFFILITVVTSFTGINVERSFWSTFERMAGTINWIHLALFFFVLTSTFKNLADWRKLISSSFIAASIVAFMFLLEKVGISVLPFESRNGATIGNSSFMAAYLLFNVFFGIWLIYISKMQWQKIFYGFGLGVLVLSMLTSTAYGAMVSMFGGFFIVSLAWLFWGAKFRYARPAAIIILCFGIAVAGIIGYGTFSQNKTITSKLPYFFSSSGTIGARKVVWEMAWRGIKERPILGWGPENFNVVFTKYFNPCMPLNRCGGEVWYDRTHNTFLDHLVYSGILGLAGFLMIQFAALWIILRKVLMSKEWILPSVLAAALISYLVQNLLVFDMPSTYIMFVFALAAVVGIGAIRESESGQGAAVRLPSPFSTVAVGLFAVYFLFSWGLQSLQAANWGIIINRGSISSEKRLEIYRKKLSVSPLGNRQVPEFFTNNMVNNLYNETNLPASFVKEVGEIMGKIVGKNPLDFRHYLIAGNYYAAAKEYDESNLGRAENFLKKAVELSPTNQQGYTSLGQVYLMRGESERGLAMLKKAADLEPRYDKAQFNLADAYGKTGDYAAAKKVYEFLISEGQIPADLKTITNIVRAYDETEDYEKAIMWLREVAESEVGKNEGDVHFKLADLLKKGGYKEEARAEAVKAKELKSSLSADVDDFLKELK